MEIVKYKSEYRNDMLNVWEVSVLAAHHFLKREDFLEIKAMLQTFVFTQLDAFCLIKDDKIAGFMGVHEQKIEMLFLEPENIGKGYAKRLPAFAFKNFGINRVDVNEQNTNAKLFYEKMAFEVYDRTGFDDMGKNYPILKMKLKKI